jgi:predicted transcriptional regulator of viral defense system
MNYYSYNIVMNRPKEQLGNLIRQIGDIFVVSAAAPVLDVSNTEAAKILARWSKQGWLTRIQRGLYAVVPMDAESTEQALEDAWLLVPQLFSPCYIGGWSAAEHWDFTEQLFRETCVLTERPVAQKKLEIHHTPFFLTHIPRNFNFGTKIVWKKNIKISVSDPHKTIIDMLFNPKLGGGIQHVIDCFKQYAKSSHYNEEQLIAYAIQLNNGAVFKKLGFLSEKIFGINHILTILCEKHLTQGLAYLDPSIKDGKLVTRWRLFIPTHLQI